MCSSRYAPLKAFGLGMLFLFMLIPADLLHQHANAELDVHGRTAHDQIHGECAICDLVLPVQLNVTVPTTGLVTFFISIAHIPQVAPALEGVEILASVRGPPAALIS